MKKIATALIVLCCLLETQTAFAKNDQDFGSLLVIEPIQCHCTYQATFVNPESEYFDPEANPTESFEATFITEVSHTSDAPASDDLKNTVCKNAAIQRGLGNAQCTNGKPAPTTKIEDEFKLQAPVLQVHIPGLEKFSDPPTLMNETGAASFPWMGEYIRAIYNFGLAIISILAVLMIIISGIRVIMSGLGGEKKEAYKRISQAVIGLCLAWGSYAILYLINPNLLNLKSLNVVLVTPITIDTEGYPEPATAAQNYKIDDAIFNSSEKVNQSCKLEKYPDYAKSQEKFGTAAGQCLGWAKKSLMDACGAIPSITQQNGAWDVAATFKSKGKFHPCNLDGIKNGDIVFMTSMGSNWIGLWENFRVDKEYGCTVADASKNPVTYDKALQNIKPTTGVSGNPQRMPPVTHIGIYYNGKIYHQVGPVAEDSSIAKKMEEQTRDKNIWKGRLIVISGYFIKSGGEFIAGYGTW